MRSDSDGIGTNPASATLLPGPSGSAF